MVVHSPQRPQSKEALAGMCFRVLVERKRGAVGEDFSGHWTESVPREDG